MSKDGILEEFDNLDNEKGQTNPTEKTEEKKEETFTAEQVEEMLKKAREEAEKEVKEPNEGDLQSLLMKTLIEQNKKPDSEKYGQDGYVDSAYIDEDDYIEKPVVFFCHMIGYVIVDDKRNGFASPNPYRKKAILFERPHMKKRGHGREQDIEYFSTYECHSKKEAKWLREHTYFGVKFFDELDLANSKNHDRALLISNYMNMVQDFDPTRVRQESRRRGIGTVRELQKQKVALAMAMADERLGKEEEKLSMRAKDAIADMYMQDKK